jgi:hypothetical protein
MIQKYCYPVLAVLAKTGGFMSREEIIKLGVPQNDFAPLVECLSNPEFKLIQNPGNNTFVITFDGLKWVNQIQTNHLKPRDLEKELLKA